MYNINLILIIIIVIIITYLLFSKQNKIEQFAIDCNSIKSGLCTSSLCPSNCKIKSNPDQNNCRCTNI